MASKNIPKAVLEYRELKLVVSYLRSSSHYWHTEAGRRISPQGIATVESRVAAGKSSVLRELAESIEKKEHLSATWREEDF